jgi:uncharacterized protein DUF6796
MDHNSGLGRFAGWVGLAGALLVGVAEFLIQFNTAGGYERAGYEYFQQISSERLTLGYYLAVLSAPLYIVGYWFLERLLLPSGRALAAAFFLIGAYAFAIGAVWLGERAFLAFTVQAISEGAASPELLHRMASYNEPLVNVLRVAMVAVSVLWVVLILRGRTALPKWMAIFNPATILASIFALYWAAPSVGVYILPVAMNVTHVIIFGLALMTCSKTASHAH